MDTITSSRHYYWSRLNLHLPRCYLRVSYSRFPGHCPAHPGSLRPISTRRRVTSKSIAPNHSQGTRAACTLSSLKAEFRAYEKDLSPMVNDLVAARNGAISIPINPNPNNQRRRRKAGASCALCIIMHGAPPPKTSIHQDQLLGCNPLLSSSSLFSPMLDD